MLLSQRIVLHNPNRRAHKVSLYDHSRYCIDLPPGVEPPPEIQLPHPDNPRIAEVYIRAGVGQCEYEYRRSRLNRGFLRVSG